MESRYNFFQLKVKLLREENAEGINMNAFPSCDMRLGIKAREKIIGKGNYLVRYKGRIYNVERYPNVYLNLAEYINHNSREMDVEDEDAELD